VIIQVQSAESRRGWRRAGGGGKTRGTGTRVRTPLCPRPQARQPVTAGLDPSIPGILQYSNTLIYPARYPAKAYTYGPSAQKRAARPAPRERARYLRPIYARPATERPSTTARPRAGAPRRAPASTSSSSVSPSATSARAAAPPRRRVRGPRECAAAIDALAGAAGAGAGVHADVAPRAAERRRPRPGYLSIADDGVGRARSVPRVRSRSHLDRPGRLTVPGGSQSRRTTAWRSARGRAAVFLSARPPFESQPLQPSHSD
jgi:hypothetical protein